MTTANRFNQNTIALVYDFDGTLSPQPMQEYTVLPKLGSNPKTFWEKVKRETKEQKATEIITYMRLMYEELETKKLHIAKRDLKALAKDIDYFPGVERWFDEINRYVRSVSKNSVRVRHYVISSGLREILEGTAIFKKLDGAFGSEYFFDHHGRATFVNRVITDSSKTQYLFRINKGKEDLAQSVNDHMPLKERPIPFSNMIYFGDGETDVPSMAVTREQGGYAIAVHPHHKGKAKCKKLLEAKRIDFYAHADFRKNRQLWLKTKIILDKMIASIAYEKERFAEEKRS